MDLLTSYNQQRAMTIETLRQQQQQQQQAYSDYNAQQQMYFYQQQLQQYQQYQQYTLQYKIQQDKVEAASLNADADYEWGAWGGMMGPGFY
jgi:hypothetical protein